MKKKQRILFIATFPPPIHGSAVVSMQIKNSKIIAETFNGDYVNLSTSKTMDEIGKVGIIPNLKKLWRFASSFLRTISLLCTHRYALCYCAITINSNCFLRDAPFVILCKMFGHKVVIHQHNKGMSKLVDKPIYRKLYPIVYKNAKVILLSWYLYPDIQKIVKKENVMICPNGIKPSMISTPSDLCSKKSCVPHIFFLSNLLPDKGVIVMLDALKILKERGVDFICDFVGGETRYINAKFFLDEIKRRDLQDRAIYHGRKYGIEKAQFFAMADVFAFPSLNEAFGIVALEAMEYGIPIVASNEGGIPEVVHDNVNGFLVEKGNPFELSDAIEKLLNDPILRQNMGDAGRKLFEERFTEEIFEKTMLACLKKSMT